MAATIVTIAPSDPRNDKPRNTTSPAAIEGPTRIANDGRRGRKTERIAGGTANVNDRAANAHKLGQILESSPMRKAAIPAVKAPENRIKNRRAALIRSMRTRLSF
ncbi:hypothetical protein [Dongia sp.]|uniref:hypothetical protein n=1 Tax=Dongia sp. TaxID=1977262 RepID=UPI0035B10A20